MIEAGNLPNISASDQSQDPKSASRNEWPDWLRRLQNSAQKRLVNFRIAAKWLSDSRDLPLESGHRELYWIIHRHCWKRLRQFPELARCRDFNDRIQWLKLFDQSREMVRCSDKILVKDHIQERVGTAYVPTLYQTCDQFSEVDFARLPRQFVLKTNHDSGSVLLVRNKERLDLAAAEQRISASLKRTYGWEKGEWAYRFIRPRILVEEFIDPASSSPPPDYKFYVIEGKVRFVHFIWDRGSETKAQVIDREGRDLGIWLYPGFKHGTGFQKPACWMQMLEAAEEIGRGFKCVRVDLFESVGRILAGEMTFWPMAGCYKGDGQKEAGAYLDFDRTTFKPPITEQLKLNGI